jgi:hypothetical protein
MSFGALGAALGQAAVDRAYTTVEKISATAPTGIADARSADVRR